VAVECPLDHPVLGFRRWTVHRPGRMDEVGKYLDVAHMSVHLMQLVLHGTGGRTHRRLETIVAATAVPNDRAAECRVAGVIPSIVAYVHHAAISSSTSAGNAFDSMHC